MTKIHLEGRRMPINVQENYAEVREQWMKALYPPGRFRTEGGNYMEVGEGPYVLDLTTGDNEPMTLRVDLVRSVVGPRIDAPRGRQEFEAEAGRDVRRPLGDQDDEGEEPVAAESPDEPAIEHAPMSPTRELHPVAGERLTRDPFGGPT